MADPLARLTIRTPARPAFHDAAKLGDVATLLTCLDDGGCEIGSRHLGHAALHRVCPRPSAPTPTNRMTIRSSAHIPLSFAHHSACGFPLVRVQLPQEEGMRRP